MINNSFLLKIFNIFLVILFAFSSNSTHGEGKYYDSKISIEASMAEDVVEDCSEIVISYLTFDAAGSQNGLFKFILYSCEEDGEEIKRSFQTVCNLIYTYGKFYKSDDQKLKDMLKNIFGDEGKFGIKPLYCSKGYNNFESILHLICKY